MNHLGRGNVDHPYVFDQGIATHVVTGILYGAQAFFVFDREVSVNENHQDIQGNLKRGEGSLKMEDKDKANDEKLSCRFYGDFLVQKPPTSFQEAVEVYQSLPKLLGANGENAVPLKKCSQFKLEFQRNLAKKLPSIRGGGEEEAVLAEELRKTFSSPFNCKDLNEWMDCKEREIYTVMSSDRHDDKHQDRLISNRPQTPKPDDAQDPHPPDQWYNSEEKMEAMRHKAKLFSDFAEANKEKQEHHISDDGFSVNENFEPSSKPATVTGSDIDHNSVMLKISPPRFGAEDITSYSVEYCVSGEDGWKQETASRTEEVTVSGLSPNTDPPGRLHVESTSREISVSWEKPAELGQDVHVLSYIVEYAKPDHQVKEEDLHWEQMMAGAEKAIISGLQPETEYAVRASSARLTPTQKNVFDSVLSTLGEDVDENIQVLVTFSDGQLPPVLEAIKASGVPCPKTGDGLPVHFKFNNSALFAQNQSPAAADSSGDEEEGGFDQMFWKMGAQSMKRFFDALDKITTKSLTMTKEVLRENVQKKFKGGHYFDGIPVHFLNQDGSINRPPKLEIRFTPFP
ncbi:hypothetical protein JOQ06_004175 [Pogonophryne albipinna]|uniref:Fibronectin type-III domain-containing protein n=1 Tax=Pogonophryne albipinna TaxID=1090488 RepID=A0AAD6A599_9TELE|nr:hypothetical protein JOQ06_004175 [Pogonophryne albipinna]